MREDVWKYERGKRGIQYIISLDKGWDKMETDIYPGTKYNIVVRKKVKKNEQKKK